MSAIPLIQDDPTPLENNVLRLWRGGKGPCRHCQRIMRLPKRGLCVTCYKHPVIRKLYPSRSKFHKGWVERKSHPLPRKATRALPGSREKVEVLMERAARQEQLFHPQDVRDVEGMGLRYVRGESRYVGMEMVPEAPG